MKQKEKINDADPEPKPKSRIQSLFRDLFKPKATSQSDHDAPTPYRSASAGELRRNSYDSPPAIRGGPLYRSPYTSPTASAGVSPSQSSPTLHHLSSAVETLPTTTTTTLHQSPVVPDPSFQNDASTRQSSTTTLVPTAHLSDLPIEIPTSAGNKNQPRPALDNSDSSTFARKGVAFLRIIGEIVGVQSRVDVFLESTEKDMTGKNVSESCDILAESIKTLTKSNISQSMKGSLGNLYSKLARIATETNGNVDDARWRTTNHLQMFLLENMVTESISPDTFGRAEEQLSNILEKVKENALGQSITILPCANAAYNDYTKNQKREPCFKGTRHALLKEVVEWLDDSDSKVYTLFGLAGIGKSTIAQTVAEKADKIHLLGASFFFSRDEEERRTAQMFFTTIASQLCIYDREFAKQIENVLLTEKGKAAVRKLPLEQLETLILGPLRKLAPRKVLLVVDALDECDENDAPTVLTGLNKLVQGLPSFKVFLTTRPQQHLQLQIGQASQKVFHLHNIEDEIVDGDIELYLRYRLSSEEVKRRLPNLRNPWAASDEEIHLLVRAAGRLFIIASTAVLFLLDKTSTPAIRMRKLRTELDRGYTSFNALNNFYTTILRIAVPEGCERDTVDLYQTVIGTIILIQHPLRVCALAKLVNVDVDDITAVLGNLQPVILLGSSDIPLVYHKSFPDYIHDPARCADEDLRIDSRFHHTRMAIHCLSLLNGCLRQNILDLGDPARFLSNKLALEKHGVTEEHLKGNIPSELRYACLYFANHIESADIGDAELAEVLKRFLDERLLNWLEVLSWIGKIDSARRPLRIVQKSLPTWSDYHKLVADLPRFIGKFYDFISRSALYTYHSALPFTPTETSLYKKYNKQMMFCRVRGGRRMWDALVTKLNCGSISTIQHIVFPPDSTLFACYMHRSGLITIHDGVAGIPIGRIGGQAIAIAKDLSKAAAFDDGSITLYNVKGIAPVATIKPLAMVLKMALSPNGSRLVVGSDDGTIGLWDTVKCEQIECFGGWKEGCGVTFSPDGRRAAFASCDGIVKLLDGISGKIVSDLSFPELVGSSRLVFSGDGSRLACLAFKNLALKVWNSQDGALIGTADDVEGRIVISNDGSLFAARTRNHRKLASWSSGGNNLALFRTLDFDFDIWSLAIHNHILAIASYNDIIILYDFDKDAYIAQLSCITATALAFSADGARLVAGTHRGDVQLWDILSITASEGRPSKPTEIAFSPDCSRLASGYQNGTIELWDTTSMTKIAAHVAHSMPVTPLAFGVDGGQFASGSEDGIIQLWNGRDGAPSGMLRCSGTPIAVALSCDTLACATRVAITVWDLKTHTAVVTFSQHDTSLLTFSHHHSLLAATIVVKEDHRSDRYVLRLWDIGKRTLVTAFDLGGRGALSLLFLPDDSQLAVRSNNTHFYLFDVRSGRQTSVSENQDISRLGLCPSWNGIPVWIGSRGNVVSRFPQHQQIVTVLHWPVDLQVARTAVGSSMIALGCLDGRILLIDTV